MKIELEIADPRFTIGDIVEIPNERNDKSMFYQILSWRYWGRFWEITLTGEGAAMKVEERPQVMSTNPDDSGGVYETKILEGSYYDYDPPKVWQGSDNLPLSQRMVDRRGKLKGE